MNRLMSNAMILVLLVGAAAACHRDESDQVTQEGTAEQQTPQGTTTTTSEVEQVGSTVAATSETEVKTDAGTMNSKVETLVGTVTKYEPGKKIEVLTGTSDNHSFDLDDKDVTVHIEGTVKVGSKVTLNQSTDDNGKKVVDIKVDAV